jgi:hypothetical protein
MENMNMTWKHKTIFSRLHRMIAGVIACAFLLIPAGAQTVNSVTKHEAAVSRSPYRPNRLPRKANLYYSQVWGVDSFTVKSVSSGEIIRFAYRVLDPEKAKALSSKKSEPYLVAPRAGVKLVIPTMEKIGKLRQTTTPVAGRSYWMAFSNKGGLVKPGDRVIVEIGLFKAEGLEVQ